MNNLAQLEALLFVAGDEGIDLQSLSDITGFDRSAILLMLEKIGDKYLADETSALELHVSDQVYRLSTKANLVEVIKRYFEAPLSTSLSNASLEVLAIVAYQQTITRVEVDEIRGVNSSGALQKLVMRGLIEERGRKDEPGRPILYGTSNFFLDYFGLNSLEELPPLRELEDLANEVQSTGDLFLQALNEREKKAGLEISEELPLFSEDRNPAIEVTDQSTEDESSESPEG